MSTQHRTFHIDGVPYVIILESFGPETSASWRCQQCESLVGSTRWAETPDEALSFAIADVWEHHDDCHVAAEKPEVWEAHA